MADRVPASITIGGKLSSTLIEQLIEAINEEGLTPEYDGGTFSADEHANGEHLTLYGNEVAWGSFNTLEAFCREHRLAYRRWHGAYAGAWGCCRVVYRGALETRKGEDGVDEYDASDCDQIFVGAALAKHLGSFDSIMEHFASADFEVPPLEFVGAFADD